MAPLREVVDLGPLVYLDRTSGDVDHVEAALSQLSGDLGRDMWSAVKTANRLRVFLPLLLV